MPRAYVGMAGWGYPPWRGTFYPEGLRQSDELTRAATRVTSIEINSSFHSTPKPASWAAWRDVVPEDFVFSVKGHRYLTVVKRLRDPRESIDRFLDSGVRDLGRKLGPILWQLPADLPYDEGAVAGFLTELRRHPLRFAVEVRHPSFADDAAGIDRWATWTRDQLAAGRDAYVYCVTENKLHSPRDAEALLVALRG